MFIAAMTLIRLVSAGPMLSGRARTSWRAPSIRYRTRMRPSWGSMWMSDARSRRAWVIMRLTTRTTGASSGAAPLAGATTLRSDSVTSKASSILPTPAMAR